MGPPPPMVLATSWPGTAFFASPGEPRASERHDICLLQVGKSLHIVGGGFPVEIQRGAPVQSSAASCRRVAPAENVFDAGARRDDALVARRLGLGQRGFWLVLATLALDVRAPALPFQSRFTLAVNIGFIGTPRAMSPWIDSWRLSASKMLSLAPVRVPGVP